MKAPEEEISYAAICEQMPIPNLYFKTYEEAVRHATFNQPAYRPYYFVKEVGVNGLDTYSTFTKKWWNASYNPPKQNLAPADESGLEYADQPTLQSAT